MKLFLKLIEGRHLLYIKNIRSCWKQRNVEMTADTPLKRQMLLKLNLNCLWTVDFLPIGNKHLNWTCFLYIFSSDLCNLDGKRVQKKLKSSAHKNVLASKPHMLHIAWYQQLPGDQCFIALLRHAMAADQSPWPFSLHKPDTRADRPLAL